MNLQPVEKKTTAATLDVFKIWPTIQGEGPWVGSPAVFVRLAGCNLQCPACDTDYTSSRSYYTPRELLGAVAGYGTRLIVLTGGEPFRQTIGPFVCLAVESGKHVQIETNGTLFQEGLPYGDAGLTIVCSPKTPSINPQLEPFVHSFKYVLDHRSVDDDGLPLTSMFLSTPIAKPPSATPPDRVFIQPLDEGDNDANQKNMKAALDSCTRFGYRLSLQIHKIIGLE